MCEKPLPKNPESNSLPKVWSLNPEPDVTVCATVSSFVQTTAPPAFTLTGFGWYALSLLSAAPNTIATLLFGGNTFVALASFIGKEEAQFALVVTLPWVVVSFVMLPKVKDGLTTFSWVELFLVAIDWLANNAIAFVILILKITESVMITTYTSSKAMATET